VSLFPQFATCRGAVSCRACRSTRTAHSRQIGLAQWGRPEPAQPAHSYARTAQTTQQPDPAAPSLRPFAPPAKQLKSTTGNRSPGYPEEDSQRRRERPTLEVCVMIASSLIPASVLSSDRWLRRRSRSRPRPSWLWRRRGRTLPRGRAPRPARPRIGSAQIRQRFIVPAASPVGSLVRRGSPGSTTSEARVSDDSPGCTRVATTSRPSAGPPTGAACGDSGCMPNEAVADPRTATTRRTRKSLTGESSRRESIPRTWCNSSARSSAAQATVSSRASSLLLSCLS
jgi:hypothetical protein